MGENIFINPKHYLSEIYNKQLFTNNCIESMIADFKGLSMMCVWITKLCPLRCEKCFFHSNMNHDGLLHEEYQFSQEGLSRLIHFINESNNGYLMLSGGGDPMMCPNHVERLIRETKTRRIVIVTSGFWGKTKESAKLYINRLYKAYTNRIYTTPCELVLRLSVDAFHQSELGGNDAFKNIINTFYESRRMYPGFSLMIHTMRQDNTVLNLAHEMNAIINPGEVGESDNCNVIKIVPQKATMLINNYEIPVGISKLFVSDLMVDMNPPYSATIKNAIKVITDDMENSEQGNPSYIQNALGRKGLDFWVDYNGNVTTWFNQDWYQLFNLYTDTYDELVNKTFSNPMTACFLRKGYEFRNNIVAEVNPRALLRAQAINLRDYYVAFLLEEDKTKLYYAIRAIQSFLSEFYIQEDSLDILSDNLKAAILLPTAELKKLYFESDYDILEQYLDEACFDKTRWSDIFMLVALGQYEVNADRLKKKIAVYVKKTNEPIHGIKDFLRQYNDDLYYRLHQRISFVKTEAKKLFEAME